eukprot:Clim_evm29s253 gene=Clim_evmTU29s253
MQVNRRMLSAKAVYGLYFAGASALTPYLPVILRARGFSPTQIGLISGLRPSYGFVGSISLCAISDKFNLHQIVLYSSFIIGSLLKLAYWICDTYLQFFIAATLAAVVAGPVIPLIDSSVVAMLGDRPQDYGKQRAWGAVGWGGMSPVVGYLAAHFGEHAYFFCFATLAVLTLMTMARIPVKRTPNKDPFWQNLKLVIRSMEFLEVLYLVTICGLAFGSISNNLFLYIDDLGGNSTIMGLSLLFTCISEVPVLQFSHHFLERMGVEAVIYTSIACYVLRLTLYSITTNPYMILPVEFLHGITFGAMWASTTYFAQTRAPANLKATIQAMLSGLWSGVGAGTGAVISGRMYDEFGGAQTFQYCAIFMAGAGLLGLCGRLVRVHFYGRADDIELLKMDTFAYTALDDKEQFGDGESSGDIYGDPEDAI